MWQIQIQERILNYNFVAGVDESGAGCLAGDLIIAACILPKNHSIEGLTDSKKLSEKQRERLYYQIIEQAVEYSIINITPETIDNSNILACRMDGMKQSIEALKKVEYAIFDGNRKPDIDWIDNDYLVKADFFIECVSAASIIAKVYRDSLLKEQAIAFPEYGFDKHKGYGTKIHIQALETYGPCSIHRYSYKPVKQNAR